MEAVSGWAGVLTAGAAVAAAAAVAVARGGGEEPLMGAPWRRPPRRWPVQTEAWVRLKAPPRPDPPCVVCGGAGKVRCGKCRGRVQLLAVLPDRADEPSGAGAAATQRVAPVVLVLPRQRPERLRPLPRHRLRQVVDADVSELAAFTSAVAMICAAFHGKGCSKLTESPQEHVNL
eukprot:SM000087S23400  [mRNA]  locus=s87:553354:554590:+ [translate_table: standard]